MSAVKQEFTTILLDMYGVILEESKGNFIPYTYGHFKEKEWERLTRQFKQEQLFTRAGNGEVNWESLRFCLIGIKWNTVGKLSIHFWN